MKKQNNILRFLYIVSAYILCNACADDDIYTSTAIKEGIPVEINLSLTIPGMDKITTRALPESEESRVNDLYVLVFDATSGSLKSRKFYPTDDIVSELENKSKGTAVKNRQRREPHLRHCQCRNQRIECNTQRTGQD